MCGIAGLFHIHTRRPLDPSDKLSILKMTEELIHRGPDGKSHYIDGLIGLGHRRLSIIDIEGGKQPIFNEDASICVIFNGEIFNFIELRNNLKLKGHVFKTSSDTEVIVHAYEEYGYDFPKFLNGQFSIAIWDRNIEEVILVRDRAGITPLFYSTLPNGDFIFASEMKALFVHPLVRTGLDVAGLEQIFTLWVNIPPRTVFKNICELAPGTMMRVSSEGITTRQYWSFEFPHMNDYNVIPIQTYQDMIEELLIDSIKIRLRADVPVGAYLSGGIDSSLICGVLASITHNNFETFSLAFENKKFDESSCQEIVQQHLKVKNSTYHVSTHDISTSLQNVVRLAERPLLRTAPAPMLKLSEHVASKSYKVVLSGEGADEIFGGYNIFKEDKIRRYWAKSPQSQLRPRLLEKLYPYIGEQDVRGFGWQYFFSQGFRDTENPFYSHQVRWNNTGFIKNFFHADLREQFNLEANVYHPLRESLPNNFMKWHPLSRSQYLEATLFLPGNLLSSQGDRMLMGNSIEGRFPFLDHRLIDFVATIPPHHKLYGLDEKYILKKVASKYVPKQILARGKQPYRAPIQSSLTSTNPQITALLEEQKLKEFGLFDLKRAQALTKKANSSKTCSEREEMALIGMASLQLLHHQFLT
ncbi:MAG: asparagine synthase (glutamine-hydrolyzing) [Bdellovibrionales bacterium GWA2_49_15]|nr:MAG: asparagine synthase (glutamine-hydrolyzing) [Bdellovibrionales bacterium GWA2_49_15]HAZ13628.1 asparagine synthase (glutamine-hydrolyzing) [Bdellovibrionales bacterium]